jgi:uncharacterized lipoprotein YmbA
MKARLSVMALLLMACTSSTPLPARYLLPADVPMGTTRVDAPVRIGLATVTVAPYLAQPGIAIETEKRQIRNARQHEWAEPLADGIRRQLRAGVSTGLGFDVAADATQRRHWNYAVDVAIERLHGTLEGEALLVARWRVTSVGPGGEVSTFRLARSVPLSKAGYAGLVEAEVLLIDGLAGEIAASLAGLEAAPTASP